MAVQIPDTARRLGDDAFARSAALQQRAAAVLPRGVTRILAARQRPFPLRFADGRGSHVWDVDGNEYVDFSLGVSALVLGHRPARVEERVRQQLEDGPQVGGSHEGEVELAERLVRTLPSAGQISFHNSGSEAVHAALTIARAITGRTRIVKFEGHFHGWVSPIVVNHCFHPPYEGTPVGGPGWPPSPDVTVCTWNDLASVERAVAEGDDVAAIILEPIAADGGMLRTDVDFLHGLRALATRVGALLVFDEILTGYRIGLGGAQELFDVMPDITTLAKAFASGYQLSAVAATREVWDASIEAGVGLSGTYNAHAMSVAAANGALETFEDGAAEIYPHLNRMGRLLAEGFREVAAETGAPVHVNQAGPMLYLTWGLPAAPATYAQAYPSDAAALADLDDELVRRGVLSMGGAARWFLSAAHTPADVEQAVSTFRDALLATTGADA